MTVPSTLEVRLRDQLIGSFTRLPGGVTVLSFDDGYAEDANRPVLSLGFLDAYGRVRRPQPSVNGEVPGFFANLLPEADLRRYVAHRAGISSRDDFSLLWVTGDDLSGAVTLHDPHDRPLPPHAEGGPETAPAPRSLLRFSLAGVQLKFSAVENAHGGLTIRAQGRDGHFIVKLPSRHFSGVPENEYAMLRFAAAVGIDVPPLRLVALRKIEGLPEEASALDGHALAIKRFDRSDDGGRIHIEDFNQVFRQQPREKYDNYAFSHVCAAIYRTMGNHAVVDFINRLIFNLAIANSDMHLKNWSVIYRDGRTPELAPAYDYVSTKLYVGGSETGLAIGSARDFAHVTLDQLERMAQRAQVSSRLVRGAALAMVERMHDEWTSYRGNVPDAVATLIDDQFVNVPVLAGERATPVGSDVPPGPTHQEIS
jgi:serine/threonine-protein kinase HipA